MYPTRTARFGVALVNSKEVNQGTMRLKSKQYAIDTRPVDETCQCSTCQTYSRSFLHTAFKDENPLACQLLTIHNLAYMMKLMRTMRQVSCRLFDYATNNYNEY